MNSLTIKETKAALREVADKLMERPQGVATMELVAEFKSSHPSAIHNVGSELFDDWLRMRSREIVGKVGRNKAEQLTLPGLGDVDGFVTIPDNEGDFRRKKLAYATIADLDADELIQGENARAVAKEFEATKLRNKRLRETMIARGFATAGEAITWLGRQGS